jgi:23S rRNA pseudouridine2605 synthase
MLSSMPATQEAAIISPGSGADMKSLSKYIASTNLCSRREAEKWIKAGRVSVADKVVTSIQYKIGPDDAVFVDNLRLNSVYGAQLEYRLFAVNKFAGELVAHSDLSKGRPLLYDRIKSFMGEFDVSTLTPVNRLDFQVEGLLLLTDNDLLAKVLAHREFKSFSFRVRVNGKVTDSKLRGLSSGLRMNGKTYAPFHTTVEKTSNTISWLKVNSPVYNISQMRDLMKGMKINVNRVICTKVGPYKIGELAPGNFEELKATPDVLKHLRIQSKHGGNKVVVRDL